jgi:hypothetical protein
LIAAAAHTRSEDVSPRPGCARQADPSLDRLLSVVLDARTAMQAELRVQPPNKQGQRTACRQLLEALEAYTAALSARGLSAPPTLRDELALQRGLASSR